MPTASELFCRAYSLASFPLRLIDDGPWLAAVPHGIGATGWTGRALQVGSDGLEIVGPAHLYSAL
jgi:hypothetical protein